MKHIATVIKKVNYDTEEIILSEEELCRLKKIKNGEYLEMDDGTIYNPDMILMVRNK